MPHVLLAPTTLAPGLHCAHLVLWGPTYLELEPPQLPAASRVSLGPTPPALVLLLFAPSVLQAPTTLALGPHCAHLVQWGPTVWELEPPQLPAASPVSPGPTPPALVPLLFAPHAPQAPTTLALGLRCALHAALAPTPLEQQPAAPCALLGPTTMALALPSAPSAARAPMLRAQGPPSAARAALAPTMLAQVQVLARHVLQAPTLQAQALSTAATAARGPSPLLLGLPIAPSVTWVPTSQALRQVPACHVQQARISQAQGLHHAATAALEPMLPGQGLLIAVCVVLATTLLEQGQVLA